jgi:hypothetical protein
MDQDGAQGMRGVPGRIQVDLLAALTTAAEGGQADMAKPMHGLGLGVFALR